MTLHDPRTRAEFESLTVPLMDALYSTARGLTGQADDAADVVQETYLRAYRTYGNFRRGTNARAWMFTILYSVFINRGKKGRHMGTAVPLHEIEQGSGAAELALPPNQTEFIDMSAPEVETALRALPETFRAAVMMVDVNELSYEEAAAALDCPVGTLRSRLFRGRKLLFASLQEYARRAGYMRSKEK
jgi:RNA polymerase sigma-70 factor (ECF subfamily)